MLIGSLGTKFTNPADVTASLVMINLGSITSGPNPGLNGGLLYDTDGASVYTVANPNWGLLVGGDGGVSQNGLTYKVDR